MLKQSISISKVSTTGTVLKLVSYCTHCIPACCHLSNSTCPVAKYISLDATVLLLASIDMNVATGQVQEYSAGAS
jgi:hypothetical protein